MRQRQSLERAVVDFTRLQRDYEDALTLIELGEAENDETLDAPQGRVARRKAGYASAIGEASHWHDRIGEVASATA